MFQKLLKTLSAAIFLCMMVVPLSALAQLVPPVVAVSIDGEAWSNGVVLLDGGEVKVLTNAHVVKSAESVLARIPRTTLEVMDQVNRFARAPREVDLAPSPDENIILTVEKLYAAEDLALLKLVSPVSLDILTLFDYRLGLREVPDDLKERGLLSYLQAFNFLSLIAGLEFTDGRLLTRGGSAATPFTGVVAASLPDVLRVRTLDGKAAEWIPDSVISGNPEDSVVKIETYAWPGMSGSAIYVEGELSAIVSKVGTGMRPLAYGIDIRTVEKLLKERSQENVADQVLNWSHPQLGEGIFAGIGVAFDVGGDFGDGGGVLRMGGDFGDGTGDGPPLNQVLNGSAQFAERICPYCEGDVPLALRLLVDAILSEVSRDEEPLPYFYSQSPFDLQASVFRTETAEFDLISFSSETGEVFWPMSFSTLRFLSQRPHRVHQRRTSLNEELWRERRSQFSSSYERVRAFHRQGDGRLRLEAGSEECGGTVEVYLSENLRVLTVSDPAGRRELGLKSAINDVSSMVYESADSQERWALVFHHENLVEVGALFKEDENGLCEMRSSNGQ